MKFKKTESGRSMVEMLGVLAIIGVLSVGGIAGYSLGMRRHRANGVADVASKYALVAYNHCQQKNISGEWNGYCYTTGVIEFKDSGVGELPAGVKNITQPHIQLNQADGTDHVNFSVEFDDDTLCKAYGAIVGSECETIGNIKTVNHIIKQN